MVDADSPLIVILGGALRQHKGKVAGAVWQRVNEFQVSLRGRVDFRNDISRKRIADNALGTCAVGAGGGRIVELALANRSAEAICSDRRSQQFRKVSVPLRLIRLNDRRP